MYGGKGLGTHTHMCTHVCSHTHKHKHTHTQTTLMGRYIYGFSIVGGLLMYMVLNLMSDRGITVRAHACVHTQHTYTTCEATMNTHTHTQNTTPGRPDMLHPGLFLAPRCSPGLHQRIRRLDRVRRPRTYNTAHPHTITHTRTLFAGMRVSPLPPWPSRGVRCPPHASWCSVCR